jgi:hypothetical protein
MASISVALFDCPHCVDEFAFSNSNMADWRRVTTLAVCWRVVVRCPGCGKVASVVMQGYQMVHNCEPDKYKCGEIVQILARDSKIPSDINYSLRLQIHRKKCRCQAS